MVVGWVNARTGKGEIDDYFLAGDQLKCDDGAESCPDTSKPVKINNVQGRIKALVGPRHFAYSALW